MSDADISQDGMGVETHEGGDDTDYFEGVEDDGCAFCDGEGFTTSCFDEIGCVDPESGCDLCTRRCSVCNPPQRNEPQC